MRRNGKLRDGVPVDSQTLPCSGCLKWLPLDAFGVLASHAHGRASRCFVCMRARRKEQRKENPEPYRIREKRSRNPEANRRLAKLRPLLYPKAVYAIGVIKNEVMRGRMKRGPCEVCGATKYVHGHHDDYDKPLVVRWLCPPHHREWHDAHGQGANIEGEPVYVERAPRRAG